MRQLAAEASGAIDAWMVDFYHYEGIPGGIDPADYSLSDPVYPRLRHSEVSKINRPLAAYVADATITSPKFAVMLVADSVGLKFPAASPWKYLDAICTYVDGLMGDPRYIKRKASGRPYLGLYATTALDTTHWNQCLSHFTHGTPYVVVADGNNTFATTIAANAVTYYGPNDLPSCPSTTPHCSYAQQMTKNSSHWFQSVGLHTGTVSAFNDRRVFMPSTVYVDQATEPQFISHITAAMAIGSSDSKHGGVFIYADNELSEGGPGLTKTKQEGTRYYDMLRWIRDPTLKPANHTYEINTTSLFLTTQGTWTLNQPSPHGVLGAYDSDEDSSSNTGDYKSLTHERMIGCGLYASKGPDRGIVEADVDGSFVADVDLYAASPAVHQLVWTSSVLSDADHTCKFQVTGTKNGSSSSTNVQLDSIQVTWIPHLAANDTGAPALYALPPERKRRRRRRSLLAA